MRTSEDARIVQLAEEMYGVETEEQYDRRLDALEQLQSFRYSTVSARKRARARARAEIKRVESVFPKSRAKKSRAKEGHSAEENREKRYNLRSRNPNFCYA
jgi:hypothetical protein